VTSTDQLWFCWILIEKTSLCGLWMFLKIWVFLLFSLFPFHLSAHRWGGLACRFSDRESFSFFPSVISLCISSSASFKLLVFVLLCRDSILLGSVGSKGRPIRCLRSSREFFVQHSVFPIHLSRSVRMIRQLRFESFVASRPYELVMF
jgi:hypothetical protein